MITYVDFSNIIILEKYKGPSADGIYLWTWAHGYEWMVTFNSLGGDQPLLVASQLKTGLALILHFLSNVLGKEFSLLVDFFNSHSVGRGQSHYRITQEQLK